MSAIQPSSFLSTPVAGTPGTTQNAGTGGSAAEFNQGFVFDDAPSQGTGSTPMAADTATLPADPKDMSNSQATQVLLDNFDTIDTKAHGGNKDGNISRADLQAIINDPSSDPHLVEAAKKVLSDPSYAKDLNSNDSPRSLSFSITKESLQASLENDQKVSDAATLLLDNFDSAEIKKKGGNLDGDLSVGDLRALIADPSTSPELRQAAQVLIEEAAKTSPLGAANAKFVFKEADLEKLVL